jgi:hypothetical protein
MLTYAGACLVYAAVCVDAFYAGLCLTHATKCWLTSLYAVKMIDLYLLMLVHAACDTQKSTVDPNQLEALNQMLIDVAYMFLVFADKSRS